MKRMRHFWGTLLICGLVFGCCVYQTSATETFDAPFVVARVTGQLNANIPMKTIAYISDAVPLDSGDIIKYDCTYTPKSASLDFGYITVDGKFHSLNCTSGSINKSIRISNPGQYQLAIRNNESYTVTVTGTVKY